MDISFYDNREAVPDEQGMVTVEPSGLQVVGHLTDEHWKAWQLSFHEGLTTYDFPFF